MFEANHTTGGGHQGGAIGLADGTSLTVTDTTFARNYTAGGRSEGGAIGGVSDALVTITGSTFHMNAAGADPDGTPLTTTLADGGALGFYGTGNTLTIANSVFEANVAQDDGGAIRLYGASSLTITGSTFTGNRALEESNASGGAIWFTAGSTNERGNVTVIEGSTFTGNTSGDSFGAIGLSSGSSVAADVTIRETGNSALTGTGGLGLFGASNTGAPRATALIEASRIEDNTASAGSRGGLSISNDFDVTVTDTTIARNEAAQDGGGVIISMSGYAARAPTLALTNVTLDGDTAGVIGSRLLTDEGSPFPAADGARYTAMGGAIAVTSGALTGTNTTIAGNTALDGGGGIAVGPGSVRSFEVSDGQVMSVAARGTNSTASATLVQSTLTGNTSLGQDGNGLATGTGGGLYVGDGGQTSNTVSATLTNTIVAGNTALNGVGSPDIDAQNLTTAGVNLFSQAGAGDADDIVVTDLALVFDAVDPVTGGGALGDNGGPVATVALVNDASNAALDAGDDALASATDARGNARVDIAGTAGNALADLGAFERQVVTVISNTGSSVDEGGTDTIRAAELAARSDDADGPPTYTLTAGTLHGTLFLDANRNGALGRRDTALRAGDTFSQADIGTGRLAYRHDGGETTADAFRFDVADDLTKVEDQVFAFAIAPVNDAPSAADDTARTHAIRARAVDVQVNDGDADGDRLEVTDAAIVRGLGSVAVAGRGVAIRYDPDGAYSGLAKGESATVKVRYTVSDGHGGSDTASLVLTVDGTRGARISGTPGDDTLVADTSARRVDGGAGEDRILGSERDDRLFGDAGEDTLVGMKGDDLLEGGLGEDTLFGRKSDDRLAGGNARDRINGKDGDDHLLGGRGDDTLRGESGADVLAGNSGDDALFGGHGDDVVRGGSGNDRIRGGNGDDMLIGGRGTDLVHAGDGEDVFVLQLGPGKMLIDHFTVGEDRLALPDGVSFDDSSSATTSSP